MPPQTPPHYKRPVGYLEAFLMGGLSILTYILFILFVEKGGSVQTVAYVAFMLAFVVNYPHFMASYYILYKDNYFKLFTQAKYIWAGVVVPGLLFAAFLSIFLFESRTWMGYMVNIMYFTVGWHYIKQIFGCLVMSNIFKSYFYSAFERQIVLFNLYALWMVSWLPSNLYGSTFNFYGLQYSGFSIAIYLHNLLASIGIQTQIESLGRTLTFLSLACVAVSLLYILYFHVERYITSRKLPHIAGILAFISIYIWYVPIFFHPAYLYVVPFLHSLQYLAFVRLYRMNLEEDSVKDLQSEEIRKRKALHGMLSFIAITAIAGALTFSIIPNLLDKTFGAATFGLGAQAFLMAFILFINIHHYFIDNVIWKKDNELVGKYLLTKA